MDAFRAAAAQRPLVLVLEDLHWAGSTALQLLAYLVEQTADARILLLASHRTTAPDRSRPLAQAIAPLYRLDGVRRLDLAGLDTEDITDYLIRESGVSAGRARACAAVLRDQTGGNPFFLRELWRDLAARGGLGAPCVTTDFQAPESVRTPSRAGSTGSTPRTARCSSWRPSSARTSTRPRWSRRRTGRTTPRWRRWTPASTPGCVEPAPGPDGSFRFPHALARQAVLGLLVVVAARARARPRRAGDRDPAPRVGPLCPAAGLPLRRAPTRSGSRTRRCATSSRRRAWPTGAWRTRTPRARWSRRPRSPRTPTSGTACCSPRRAATCSAATSPGRGSWPSGWRRAARLGTGCAAAIAYEAASWRPGHPGERSVELLSAALATIDRQPADPDYVRAIASLGRALAFTDSTDEARALGNRAIELAEALGDDHLLADALQASLWHGLRPRDAPAKLERATRLSALAHRTGDLGQLGPAAYYRGAIAYLRGDPESMDGAYADLVRTARATGQGFFGYMAGCMEYARQFVAGEFAAAERTCAGLLEMGESFGTDDTEGPYGVQTYMLRRETGTPRPGARAGHRATSSRPTTGPPGCWRSTPSWG